MQLDTPPYISHELSQSQLYTKHVPYQFIPFTQVVLLFMALSLFPSLQQSPNANLKADKAKETLLQR